jgi:hypothetical protein
MAIDAVDGDIASVTVDGAYDSIGGRLRARSSGGQVTEAVVACKVLNQMTNVGRPKSYSIGR